MASIRPPAGRVLLPLVALLVLAAVIAALIWSRDSGSAPQVATGPPLLDRPEAALPEPASVNEARPPLFSDWLRWEPDVNRDNPLAQTAFVDAMLAHRVFQHPPSGVPSQLGRALMLEDDELLLSSGRRLWTRELAHEPGMIGRFCYVHSTYCLGELFRTQFFIDGKPAVIYGNQYRITRMPSHTLVEYFFEEIVVEERKFITWNDEAIAVYTLRSNDGAPHRVSIEVSAPYPPIPDTTGPTRYPLMAQGKYQGADLHLYLDAPRFERSDAAAVHLRDLVDLDADGSPAVSRVAYRFENEPRSDPFAPIPADVFERHQSAYNRWFAENVPYFDCSDPAFKKMWYYRWWIVRFNMNEVNTPDLRGYSFYEGKLGFDNVISFAVPVQLKELTYLRDGAFALSQAQNSYRNTSSIGAVVDPPGSPYWGEMYSQWIALALAEYHRVHPIDPSSLRALLPAIAGDIRAWTTEFDRDGDQLPERIAPRLTGYDLDILSFWYFHGLRFDRSARLQPMERADFASFVFANARGAAELARAAGDATLAGEMDRVADGIRAAVLDKLWDDDSGFFYPQRAADDARAPVRELHGFFPFAVGLAPDEARYTRALAKLIDPQEFWARFGPVITSQAHYREWTWEMDGLTRNIAPHPITMGARIALEAAKHYDSGPIRAEHFMELMRRYNDLVYPGVHPGDPHWRPNAHEYFSKWEEGRSSARPEASDISHDFHSAFNYLVVEGAVGLTPRSDQRIEIDPLAHDWDYFLLDRLRHRGRDLTILWDRPDGNVRYEGEAEGFSLYIDGERVLHQEELQHVIYDPATGSVSSVGDGSRR